MEAKSRPIDEAEGLDGYENDAQGGGGAMDADFGNLEMFDSNAPAEPTSSQVADAHSRKASKKAKKSSEEAAAAALRELGGEDAGQSKRKRRGSDGAERKRKKKKKADESNGAETAPIADMGDMEDVGSDPQASPTVAHVRRRSMSEARSRENSTSRSLRQGDEGDANAVSNMDVENLAREAWKEHINGNGAAAAEQAEADAQIQQAAAEAAAQAPAPTESPKAKRSTRKKAKPSFFEQPHEEADDAYEPGELPSPSAMTPKPRKRAKAASKKRRGGPKLSQSMRGDGDEPADDDPDAPRGRRNRMAGFTTGRFTDEELEKIGRQVKAFADENQLSQHEVNEMIQAPGGTSAGEAHAQLWSRLVAECPDRHRQKVINITRKKFHNFVARGTWTPEQENELRQLVEIHGSAWAKIAALINRHPEDLRDRYRNYIVCGDAQRKDTWTEEEEARLAQYVIEAMASIDELRAIQPSRQLLQKPYEELIDWQNISERMERTRSRLQCITKWKSMNMKTHGRDMLASQQPNAQISFNLDKARRQIRDMPAAERYRLLLAIRASEVGTDAKIPYYKLNDKEYRNKWHRPTLIVLWNRLKRTVPGYEKKTVRDCALHLIEQYDRTDELPDVDGDNYNDAEEMAYLEAPTASQGRRSHRSEDYVHDSDDEANEGAEAQDQEAGMQIDPALMAEGAQQEAEPPKKTPKKKSASGKRGKKGSKKSTMLSQDPIEDDAGAAEAPAEQEQAANSDIEDSRPRKKTPRKFQSGKANGKKRDESPAQGPTLSSDMEDMEDLPAQSMS